MASASSDSGLYRTTSASTASSSGGPPMYTTASTSATESPRRKLNGQTSQTSLHDGRTASDSPSKRVRRKKNKTESKKQVITSSASSCLPGFVAATSLTSSRQSPSPVKSVATSIDAKGKGRARDDGSGSLLPGTGSLLPSTRPSKGSLDPSDLLRDSTNFQTVLQTDKVVSERDPASPEDSAASSTDEMPYAPSPTVSPHVTPQAKVVTRAASATPKSSPFKPVVTGFDILAARNLAVFGNATLATPAPAPNTEGLGIAGKGLESMPTQEKETSVPPLNIKEVRSTPSYPGKKRVTSSPLTWSTEHQALDAPTLGSPTLCNMRESENVQEVARSAITKAAFSVSQATILQELANRKAQKKWECEQAIAAQSTPDPLQEHEVIASVVEGKNDEVEENQVQDEVKRRDMALPKWQTLSPPSDKPSILNGGTKMPAASSAPDRSPLLGDGTTSATADIEDDVDDGASDASNTSFLVHSVVRDDDLAQGWEALDASYSTKEKARRRLENAIYQLNKRHRPSQAVISARREMLMAIRKRLNWMLKDWAPDFQYNLETFGSTKYGLDTDSSDLDLCIVDPRRPDGFRNACDLYDLTLSNKGQRDAMASTEEDEEHNSSTPFSRHKKNKDWAKPDTRKRMALGEIYDVQRLADTLRKMGHQQVIAIPNAIVPIVKFKSREGIKADMNPNEQLGVRNSTLLAEYISLKPIIRPFLIFLKVWAKQRHLNDPSGQKGLMSLSSYSLVLMAIAFLQHAGFVPNLQSVELISKACIEREVFWSKVPNPDAPKASHWTKRKYLGDYKAMAIDTTFVRAERLDAQTEAPATTGQSASDKKMQKNAKTAAVGWDSGDDTQSAPVQPQADGSLELLKLIEGFFEYYLGFPTENKAISIWRGKPIDRKIPFHAESPSKVKRALKVLRNGHEQLHFEGSDGHITPKNGANGVHSPNGRQSLSESGNTTTSESTAITEDEELQALYDKIEGNMRKLGVKDEAPSFELTLKSGTTKKKKKRSRLSASADQEEGQKLPAMQEIDALEEMEEANAVGPASSAHKGLEAWQASPDTNLFPVPPIEDPEMFNDPPTWTQPLVVQDPFIHTRNTTMNIVPETVSMIWKEMQRALDMVKAGDPLDKICHNLRHESTYERKGQFRSRHERERRRPARADTKNKFQKRGPRQKDGRRADRMTVNAIDKAIRRC